MKIQERLKSVNVLIVSFVVAGILIGVLVAAQFQSSVAANSYLVDELNAQNDLLDSFDDDRLQLKNQIAALRQQVDENRKKLELSGDEVSLEKLDKLKSALGLRSVSGPGVRINFAEGVSDKGLTDPNFIHASDLRDLVNLLRSANVQGISINGQRIIVSSTINSLGNTIMVNKVTVAAPFKIDVVGDTELIGSRLNDQQSYPDLYRRIKNKEVGFVVEKEAQLVLPAYDGDYLLKYASNANG